MALLTAASKRRPCFQSSYIIRSVVISYNSCDISFVFSVQLIKITKPNKKFTAKNTFYPLKILPQSTLPGYRERRFYRGFLDLGNACLRFMQNWKILKICLDKHCSKLC